MPRQCIPIPGGFICGPRAPVPRCSVPSCGRPAEFECDYPIPRKKSGTCDARLCAAHRTEIAPGRDACPPHSKQTAIKEPTT